jgi:flagellar basal-body rod protein FlgF
MTDSIHASTSNMEALTRQYEAIAHNLANANTTGYKRLVTAFMRTDVPAKPQPAGSSRAGTGASSITGKTFIDFTQGAMVRTDRPLDLALHGKGFYVLETPAGELYTRNGTFQVNAQGQLVDAAGRNVAGDGGPIVIPKTAGAMDVSVTSDGRVSAAGNAVGKLRIVEFEKPDALVAAGECAFRAPRNVTPAPATQTTVQQGFQEASNVSVVDELVGLITVSRLYEANVKTIQMRDERFKNILQVAMG